MDEVLRVRRHIDLTAAELEALENLFDSEYRNEFGFWNPDAPYGYSPADTHIPYVSGLGGTTVTEHLSSIA